MIQAVQQQDYPEAPPTSTLDLENCRNRLVSKVLSCRNQPARLDLRTMAQQLQEAQVGPRTRSPSEDKPQRLRDLSLQDCRDAAQSRLSRLSDAASSDALDLLEDQWSSALQDAAAVVQQKEAELQMVSGYLQQAQTARTSLERLQTQLDAARRWVKVQQIFSGGFGAAGRRRVQHLLIWSSSGLRRRAAAGRENDCPP